MSDRTFARKKTTATNFAQPSLVSSTTPTLANPTRGFGLTNNVIQKAADISTEQQEVQAKNERSSLEQLTIQEKPLTHDISRISFHRPQAKLTVGKPGDQYEQEADWVANRIMRMAIPNQVSTSVQPGENSLQRKCAGCEEEEKAQEIIQTKSIIQRDDISGLPPVPNYQLSPPSLLQPLDPASRYRLGGDMSLHLDPQFQVMMQQVQQQVNPSTVRTGLDQVNLQLPTPSITTPATPNPFALPSTPTASPPAPAREEPSAPRAGTPGDIMKAILKLPEIDAAVTSLGTQVGDRVTRDWQRLNAGETIATVSTLVAIGGGALAGIISDPSARRFALDQLNGRTIPVPYLNWLNLEINTGGDNLMLGLHIDVGQLLPSSWGFRGSSASAIGGSPQPEPLPGMIQRQIESEANIQTSTDLESRLNSSKGGGSPLGDTVRSFMEPRFGADFSSVRVHTDSTAVQMNRELGAQAFTHGSDVYFGAGKAPGNNELTAHELTHVVQQNNFTPCQAQPLAIQRRVTFDNCEAKEWDVKIAHETAIRMCENTIAQLNKYDGKQPAKVKAALAKHFHSTTHKWYFKIAETVAYNLACVVMDAKDAQYECHDQEDQGTTLALSMWCVPFTDILLYKKWFAAGLKEQANTLVHEWMHRYGCAFDLGYDWEPEYINGGTFRAIHNAEPYGNIVAELG